MAIKDFPRRGAWAVVDGTTCIVTGFSAGTASIDFVDETGCTTVAAQVDRAALRQATLAEIPEPRRPAPEVGALYGYV